MDLIYTNSKKVDQGVLGAYAFDLSYGASENDFEMTLGADEPALEFGAFAYIEGTEYGGIVDGIKTTTNGETITYMGRTWHGMINSKVIEPNANEDYLIVSGDANEILQMLIDRLGLNSLFKTPETASGVFIKAYQFHRYCKGYDGIRAMLAANNAKLKIVWKNRSVYLYAEPITDYTKEPIDSDMATIQVEKHEKKVNHLICLGKGDLAEREVIHLYVDQFGNIGDVQYYTGIDEVAEPYDNSNSDDLRSDGIEKFKELRGTDKAEIAIHEPENENTIYDIGDIVGATEKNSGVSVAEAVTQKIVKINNGSVSTEYKSGG